MEDLIVPICKFIGVSILVSLPAIAYFSYATATVGPLVVLFSPMQDPIFVCLIGLAAFLWPIAVLMAALGGLGCFMRPDMIARTIARTFVPYVVTFALTGAAVGITYYAEHVVQNSAPVFGGSPIVTAIALTLVEVYFTTVAMQCVGLYYYHFKGRFAWSWG